MILIVVKHPVRPEFAEDWQSLVAPFTEATRAETGNISFEWCRSLDDPNLYVLIEAFRDGEAGRAHVESEHFQAAIAQMPKWLSAVPEIVHVDTGTDGWSRMSEPQIEP
jgi:quinol monooxygenase YgiN